MFENSALNAFYNLFDLGESDHREVIGRLVSSIKTEEDKFLVSVELPGIAKENISTKIENDLLEISTEYKDHPTRKGKYSVKYHISKIDTEKASAILKDGILTISLPKIEEVKPKMIDIKVLE